MIEISEFEIRRVPKTKKIYVKYKKKQFVRS